MNLTTGDKVKIGAAGTLSTALIGAALIHGADQNKTDARIASNERVIPGISRILDGVVYLGNGVNVRSSAEVDAAKKTREGADPGNLKFTVGEGKYAGKLVVVTNPGIITGKDGNDWLVFDEPGTKNNTLHDAANHAGYVDMGEIALQSPESLVVNGSKDGSPAHEITVDYISDASGHGGFENSASDQMVDYALSATAPVNHGK